MPIDEGQTICNGKYEIIRLLGEGGQSRVWLAQEVKRGLEVAIKEPLPVLSPMEREELETRFQRELRLSGRIFKADVPNVVRVLTVEEHEGQTLLVMEYCGGGTLADRLKKGPLPVDEAVRVTLEVLAALEVAHEKLDIVHRDIKPSNILFTEDGHAKLAGFGLAQTGESGRSMGTGQPHPGTLGYRSPEQDRTLGYLTPASDLYTVGCVLFEMLTEKKYQRVRPGMRASSLNPAVPSWLEDILAKALQEDRWERYETAAEMAAALQTGLQEAENRRQQEAQHRAEAEERARREQEVHQAEKRRPVMTPDTAGRKPDVDWTDYHSLTPREIRERLGDGTGGGEYERDEKTMREYFQVAVEDVVQLLRGPWEV
ncbi:MAG: serine/threonine-protein kinase [Anaerolineae bacterium]|nr:serine/threonine-protein kinase [Anaerolineae bacterium]